LGVPDVSNTRLFLEYETLKMKALLDFETSDNTK
jgi:hypothetical protein